MKDKLSEIIQSAVGGCAKYWADVIADKLIAEGVIVPPMRLGQTCFCPYEWRNEVDECKVSSILQKADGSWKIRITNFHYRSVFEITPNKIGKTVFLTKEEAEKALERSENGKS